MKKRFKKIYFEIGNICNLSCSFCPGTKRKKGTISLEDFSYGLDCIKPYTDYVYLHLMGEPLLHPDFEKLLNIAIDKGFKVSITTNGTLLKKYEGVLLKSNIYKLSISLQAGEANESLKESEEYLKECFEFGKAVDGKYIVCFRLWNEGGDNKNNGHILELLKSSFNEPWAENRSGYMLAANTYLENGDKFDWPDIELENSLDVSFCYGLRDQLGILFDGTVVPCCLDHDGDIALGNIFKEDLETILGSQRALDIYNGFSKGEAKEKLCQRCGYASRFKKG